MGEKVLQRSEVDVQYTWDLTSMYADDAAFDAEAKKAEGVANELKTFRGKITDADTVNKALDLYRLFQESMDRLGSYRFLAVSVDLTNGETQNKQELFVNKFLQIISELSFIDSEILLLSDETILAAAKAADENAGYLREIIRTKKYTLHADAEKTLKALGGVFESPSAIHMQAKMADLDYENFTVDGKEYPMSFVLFENKWESVADTAVRRTAFEFFSTNLRKYSNTMAGAYYAQLQREKVIADLRGYESVFDYLLFSQKVDTNLYNRQIDTIMAQLAAPMRKYVTLLKKTNKLDVLTFADLKTAVDYEYEPKISMDESRKYINEALNVYGPEYTALLNHAFDDRWIDFVQNKGKSSGAFCASPYGAHPYILISWTQRMEDVFVLAHELGHAGHFYLAQQHQNVFDTDVSMYFVEAPSTMNEMLMANYLIKQKPDDLRFRRWVLSSMISRTYYHNFVTHLLEAHFQREVYKIIDAGGSVQAGDLNALKRKTLETFWGDTVELTEGAELTWMRQPHYYNGLYSYTYSAGLTIATAVSRRIQSEGQAAVEDWKNVLKAGGSKTPVELAAMAGVDITTDKPLKDTIAYISGIIDEIIELTEKIDGIRLD